MMAVGEITSSDCGVSVGAAVPVAGEDGREVGEEDVKEISVMVLVASGTGVEVLVEQLMKVLILKTTSNSSNFENDFDATCFVFLQ